MPPSSAYELKAEDAPFNYNNESWLDPTSPFSLESYPTQYQLDLMNSWWGTYYDGLPCSEESSPVGASPVYSRNYSGTYSAQEEFNSLTIWEASAQNKARQEFQTCPTELRGDPNNQLLEFEPCTADPQSSIQTHRREKHLTARVQELTSPRSSKSDYEGKRRVQNRLSQRKFRESQKTHMQNLEEGLKDLTARHMQLKEEYLELDAKYHSLLKEPQRGDSGYKDNLDCSEAGDR